MNKEIITIVDEKKWKRFEFPTGKIHQCIKNESMNKINVTK